MNQSPLSVADPYEMLASFYDQLMAHVNYGHWAQFTTSILLRHGLPNSPQQRTRLLEAACGTGTLAMLLAVHGLDVDAFDRSGAMIAEAKRKSLDVPGSPRFFTGDFETFEAEQFYDAAICLYDSINYLLEPEQVTRFLHRMKGVLKPGGLFLFDICTELNSILHFNGRKEREAGPGYRFVRTMRYRTARRIQENDFEITLDGSPDHKIFEYHRQHIYTTAEMRGFIADSGLLLVDELDGYEIKRPTSRSLRVHFLVKRPLE